MENTTQLQIQQEPLKYLFTCHLTDGTVINQAPDNKPTLSATGSAFTDVANRIDEVEFFQISGEEEQYAVDLTNGLFYINGKEVCVSDPSTIIPEDVKRRLIYFRRNRIHFSGDGQEKDPIEYFIGWQATVNGKNIQQTISII